MDKLTQPFKISLEKDKTYFFCTCAHSAKYPFCDGSHKTGGTDKRSLSYVCDEAKTVIYVDGQVIRLESNV